MTEPRAPSALSDLRPVGKFVSGFMFGLGFALATLLVAFAGFILSGSPGRKQQQPEQSKLDKFWLKHYTPAAGLAIESHEAKPRGKNLYILGSVRNGGTDNWDGVKIQVSLLGPGATLVGLCDGYVSASLRAGQSRPFSVACDGSEREPVPEHETYTVEIVDANYQLGDGA